METSNNTYFFYVQGYFGDDKISLNFQTSDGWYKSGDVGFFDGTRRLLVVGRKVHMLKVVDERGEKVKFEGFQTKCYMISFIIIPDTFLLYR